MKRILALLAMGAVPLLPACLGAPSTSESLRGTLKADLGWDPVELLSAMAAPTGNEAGRAMAEQLFDTLSGQLQLRMLRFGLGHADERVVFGAIMLIDEFTPVPELRHAAEVALPRLGQPDCPLEVDHVLPVIGGRDFAALVDVMPRLAEAQAVSFMGSLHRMARPDAMEALCAIATASSGKLRTSALSNAGLVVAYGGEGPERLLRTLLRLAGRDSDPALDDDRLPDLLRQALRELIEPSEVGMHATSCARWLASVKTGDSDLPLLRSLLTERYPMPEAAAWAIGSAGSDAAGELLAAPCPEGVTDATWAAARARNGDAGALEDLLASTDERLAYGVAIAPPGRRRHFFRHLLSLDESRALDAIESLGKWASGEASFQSWALPPCEPSMIGELEVMLARDESVNPSVLRACVAQLPCCATGRMADKMLRMSPRQLMPDSRDLTTAPLRIGYGSVWGFLEATRPARFRRWLRQGFAGEPSAARDVCAALLLRLGDTANAKQLVAWAESADSWLLEEPLLMLARDREDGVVELLRAEVRDDRDGALAGLAVGLGLPYGYVEFLKDPDELDRDLLLADEIAPAFLATRPDPSVEGVHLLLEWNCEPVTRQLRTWRTSAPERASTLYRFDQAVELASGDPERIESVVQPLHDGRYATHHSMSAHAIAAARGIEQLPWLVRELGTNCCKVVFLEVILRVLFGAESGAFDRSRLREPASTYLRRTLVPIMDRLRYSRIAGAYVVAGD